MKIPIDFEPVQDAEATFSAFLDYIKEKVNEHSGQTWSLAGDGGFFAFCDDDVTTMAEQGVNSALAIIDNLNTFNTTKSRVEQQVRARVAVHIGDARYHKETGRIQSDDTEFVIHLEQDKTAPNSVSISESVYRELRGKLRGRFYHNGIFDDRPIYTSAPREHDKIKLEKRITQKEIAIQLFLRSFPLSLFGSPRPDLCITVLIPDRHSDEYIRPKYRFSSSSPVGSRCKSKAQFSKGIALAGFAWETPEILFRRNEIGPFNSEAEFQDFYRSEFKMPDSLIDRLSRRMRKVRSIMCWGLLSHNGDFIGVLSVDSTYPYASDDISSNTLVPYVKTLASMLLEIPE